MATETYELCIDGIEGASYRSTVLHFSGVGVNSNDTIAAADSLIQAWIATLQTLFLASLPISYSVTQLRARRAFPPPSGVSFHKYALGSQTGTRGSSGAGQQTNPVVFLVPTMGHKSGGKVFWPAVAGGDIVNSKYISAFLTATQAWANAAIAGVTASGITWNLCIFSRKLKTSANVSKITMSPVIGFQSKRRRPSGAV